MMAIYSDLLDIVGKEQTIRDMQGRNSLHAAQTEQIQKQSALQDEARKIMREAQLARDAADTANQPTTPQTAPDGSPVAALDPTTQAIQNGQRDYRAYSAEAAALRRSGAADPKAIVDAELRAHQAYQQMFHYQNLAFDQQKEKAKRLSAMAGAVNPDGSNVGNVVSRVDEIVPGWSKKADLDRDLMGNVVWGKHTQDALASTQRAGASANEQIIAQQRQAQIKFNESKLELDRQKEIRLEKDSRQKDSLARDGLALRERQQKRLEGKDASPKAEPIRAADVKDEAARIKQDNPTLTEPDSKAAARDYLGKTQDLMRQGRSREDAQTEAQAFINSKIEAGTPGKPYVSHWFEPDEPAVPKVPGKYKRGSAAEAPVVQEDQTQVDAGIRRVADANNVSFEEAKAALKAAGKIK